MSSLPLLGAEAAPRRNLARIYALEIRYEWVKQLRLPAYVVPTLAFPLMFYMIFGVAMKQPGGGFDLARYLLATYGALGVMNACLFGLVSSMAIERGQGWMLLKRATPMPPLAHLMAKLVVCLAFGAVVTGLLFALGAAFGGVRMPLATWLELAAVLLSGSVLPYAALGLALSCWAGPNAAPALVNLISLPMAFVSGMWLPISLLPHTLRVIARFLPAYHSAQLALRVLGAAEGVPVATSAALLSATTLLALAIAWAGYRRDEGKTYG